MSERQTNPRDQLHFALYPAEKAGVYASSKSAVRLMVEGSPRNWARAA